MRSNVSRLLPRKNFAFFGGYSGATVRVPVLIFVFQAYRHDSLEATAARRCPSPLSSVRFDVAAAACSSMCWFAPDGHCCPIPPSLHTAPRRSALPKAKHTECLRTGLTPLSLLRVVIVDDGLDGEGLDPLLVFLCAYRRGCSGSWTCSCVPHREALRM